MEMVSRMLPVFAEIPKHNAMARPRAAYEMNDSLLYVACLIVMTATLSFVGGMAWQKHRYATRCEAQANEMLIASHQMSDRMECTFASGYGREKITRRAKK